MDPGSRYGLLSKSHPVRWTWWIFLPEWWAEPSNIWILFGGWNMKKGGRDCLDEVQNLWEVKTAAVLNIDGATVPIRHFPRAFFLAQGFEMGQQPPVL